MTWIDDVPMRVRYALHRVLETEGPEGAFERLTSRPPRIPIPIEVRAFLDRRSGNLCEYCGAPPGQRSHHVDHIVPLDAGGTNAVSNLAIACPRCNLTKGTRPGYRCECGRLRWPGGDAIHLCGDTSLADARGYWPCDECAGHAGDHSHTDPSGVSWSWPQEPPA